MCNFVQCEPRSQRDQRGRRNADRDRFDEIWRDRWRSNRNRLQRRDQSRFTSRPRLSSLSKRKFSRRVARRQRLETAAGISNFGPTRSREIEEKETLADGKGLRSR